jgi:hypothetical protein
MKIKSSLIIAVLATAILCSAGFAKAQATDNSALLAQLQAEIQSLMQQIQQLISQQQGGQAWCYTFNTYLVAGSTNSDVSYLQTALTKQGFDVSGDDKGVFGDNTAAAVVQFQAKYGIRQTGTVGPITRTKLNSLYGCATTPVQSFITVTIPQTTPVGGLMVPGAQIKIGQVMVAAGSKADVRINTITFNVVNSGFSGALTISNPSLDDTSFVPVYGASCSVSGNSVICTWGSLYRTDYVISANQSQTFNLLANISVTPPPSGLGGSISTSLSPTGFIWDDTSTNGASGTDQNGSAILNFPTNSYTIEQVVSSTQPSITVTSSPTGSVAIGSTVQIVWTVQGSFGSIGIGFCPAGKLTTDNQCTESQLVSNTGNANISLTGGTNLFAGQWYPVISGYSGPNYTGTFVQATGSNFTVGSTTSCTPNWQCQYGTCVNGYKSQTLVDLNNCGQPVSSAGYAYCPALAQQCNTTQSSITVTSPASGATWNIGSPYNISWVLSGLPANVLLSIGLNGDGQTSTMAGAQIATNISASLGNYLWTVPSFLGENLSGKKYSVYATCINCSSLPTGGVSSGYVTIAPAPVYSGGGGGGGSSGTGYCEIRGGSASIPSENDDVGNGYARVAKPGVNTITGLQAACSASDYAALLTNYCAVNSSPVQQEVITYGANGGFSSSSCGGFGCGSVSCPTTSAQPSFSFSTPTLVSVSTTPAQQLSDVNGATSQVTYNFTTTGGSATITELKFGITGSDGTPSSSVVNICIGQVCATPVAGVADLIGLQTSVSGNNAGTNQTATVYYAPAGNGGLTSGTTASVSLIYVGYIPTEGTAATLNVNIPAPTITLINPTPTNPQILVSINQSSPAIGLILGGQNQIGQATVTAGNQSSVKVNTITFNVASSGISGSVTISNPLIANGYNQIQGSSCTSSGNATITCSLGNSYPSDFMIAQNQSQMFNLFAIVNGTYSGQGSISTSLSQAGFIWDDTSTGGASGTGQTGSAISNFPINSWTIQQ